MRKWADHNISSVCERERDKRESYVKIMTHLGVQLVPSGERKGILCEDHDN